MTFWPGLLLVVALLAVAGFLIWVFTRPELRIGNHLQQANQAHGRRDHEEALRQYDRAERMRVRIRDEALNKASEFAIEQGRGMVWLAKDRFADAEPHLLRASELLGRGVKQEQSVVVFLYADLASAQFGQGKEADGNASLSKVQQLCATTIKDDAEDVAELLSGAAAGASAKNQFDLAFRLARMAVELLSGTSAWHAGLLADVQINLAAIHALVGEYGMARKLVEDALALSGDDQLDAMARDNAEFYLGQLYLIGSDFPKAIDLLQRSVEFRGETSGRDHWRTGISRAALAVAYRAHGDYQAAERHFRDAYESQAEQLGEDDLILIGTGLQFALLLCDLGRYDEADRLLQAAEAIASEVARSDANTLPARRLIRGVWHLDLMQFEEAIAALQESFAMAQSVYGERNIMTADYGGLLGTAFVRARRYEEAERIMRSTLEIRESAPDSSELDLADLLVGMAELYLATDRTEQAFAVASRARDLIVEKVLPTHLMLARLHAALCQIASRQGARGKAIGHLRSAEEIHAKVHPSGHPRMARLNVAAADVLSAAGDLQAAERYRAQADRRFGRSS